MIDTGIRGEASSIPLIEIRSPDGEIVATIDMSTGSDEYRQDIVRRIGLKTGWTAEMVHRQILIRGL